MLRRPPTWARDKPLSLYISVSSSIKRRYGLHQIKWVLLRFTSLFTEHIDIPGGLGCALESGFGAQKIGMGPLPAPSKAAIAQD